MQELKERHAQHNTEVNRLRKEMQRLKRRAREECGPIKLRAAQRSIARVLVCLNNGEPTAAVEYVARSNKTTCWDGVKKGKLEAELRDWWKAADVETRQRHMVVDESNANMHKACVQAKRFIVDGTLEEWVDSQNVQKGINPVPAIVLQEAVSVKRRIGVEHLGNRQSSRRWLQRWAASTWNTASAWQCAGAPDARPDALEGEAWSSPKIDRGVDWFWVAGRGGDKKW